MERKNNAGCTALNREPFAGLTAIRIDRPLVHELHVKAEPLPGENLAGTIQRLANVVQAANAQVVKMDVFGAVTAHAEGTSALETAFGRIDWPVLWIEGRSCQSYAIAGIHVHAVAGVPVESVRHRNRIVGRVFEDIDARYCALGDLGPTEPLASSPQQAASTFGELTEALALVGMSLPNVVRTWLYLDGISGWYDDLNAVRNELFAKAGLARGLLPASTGIGARNPSFSAISLSALAMHAKSGSVQVRPVESPLQCPAANYGSAFSRAVEIQTPHERRVLVSGTASIEPGGHTACIGDVEGQIHLTTQVVRAILDSRNMSYNDVTRAVAYVKHAEDGSTFARYRAANGLDDLPVIVTQADICRDDLLFEMEVDAVTATVGN